MLAGIVGASVQGRLALGPRAGARAAQITVWAMVFVVAGEFAAFTNAFYHSAVNYTTLGYGDIVMSPRVRLLGPLEAISGTLAFGWSTAVIVTVVLRLVRLRHQAQRRRRTDVNNADLGRRSDATTLFSPQGAVAGAPGAAGV